MRLTSSASGFIGPVVSTGLLARLPELRRCAIRTLLYISVLSLWRTKSDKTTSATLRRMTAQGKATKIILIFLARKIVTIANAVLRDQAPFRVTPQT